MASIFGKIKSKIAKVFGSKTPTHKPHNFDPQDELIGQVRRRRKLLAKRVREGKSREIYKNRKDLGAGGLPSVEDFLNGASLGMFASSCVYQIVYDRRFEILHVQWLGGRGKNRSGPGRWAAYKQVTKIEAAMAWNASSKGIFSWDTLRQRGTLHGNKKPYVPDLAPASDLPLRGFVSDEAQERLDKFNKKKL